MIKPEVGENLRCGTEDNHRHGVQLLFGLHVHLWYVWNHREPLRNISLENVKLGPLCNFSFVYFVPKEEACSSLANTYEDA